MRSMCKLLSLLALINSGISQADYDRKTIPGAICQTTGASYDELNMMRLKNGTMLNRSDKPQTWTCPLVRDIMAGSLNGTGFSVTAKMASLNYADKVKCVEVSRTESNKYHQAKAMSVYSDRGGDVWEVYSSGYLSTPAYGPVFVRCTVPGKRIKNGKTFYSGIADIYWKETN